MVSLSDPKTHEEVICAHCEHIQWEPKSTDKYAWVCRNCQHVTENGEKHLLTGIAEINEGVCGWGWRKM